MIIFVCVNLKKIFNKQRKYAWPRPKRCPRCGLGRLWGHGFVLAYFDDFVSGLYLRRYRCPDCGCVVRLRPKGYFVRIQAAIETIRSSIGQRIGTGRWPVGLSRARQGHWLRALTRNAVAYFGNVWKSRLLQAFDRLISLGIIPVSRAIEPAKGAMFEPAYPSVP
jgi:DNA-directed RNA polymerase subunit RPC12/RpoP